MKAKRSKKSNKNRHLKTSRPKERTIFQKFQDLDDDTNKRMKEVDKGFE